MNLFSCIPVEHDATSFYRGLQPIAQLRRVMPNLHVFHSGKQVTMTDVAQMDICFLQRPSGPDHVQLIDLCKMLKIKVWVDYDDNLFAVPRSNPAHGVYENEKTQKNMKEILNKADVISVSTAQLGRDLSKLIDSGKKSIHVIPNAFNDYLFTEKPVFKPHNLVVWRGTQSHQEDLHLFAPHVIEAAKQNEKWLFNFMGYNPFFILQALGKRGMFTQPVEIIKYHEILRQTYPNLCMVMLSDTPFNRCKSNIAWIEATYGGAVTLGPQWEEWQKPGVMDYLNPENFGEELISILKHGFNGEYLHRLSWEYIQDNLRLSQVNKLRAKLLEEVMR